MIRIVLDANILYSAALRGLILHLGTHEAVEPYWSEEIQNEWTESLLRNRPDLRRASLERTRRNMAFHFPNALVQGYESLIPTLWLPDPKDRHVLAVAIHAEAQYIVTFNLEDFPDTILPFHGIEAVSPDDLVVRLLRERPDRILRAITKHRLSLTRPPKTVEEYLETLEKQGLYQTVAFLRQGGG